MRNNQFSSKLKKKQRQKYPTEYGKHRQQRKYNILCDSNSSYLYPTKGQNLEAEREGYQTQPYFSMMLESKTKNITMEIKSMINPMYRKGSKPDVSLYRKRRR